jgi:DNA-binding transcriptional LysR family regulator
VRSPQVLPYLRTFHVVATERSFTRAARVLALSQPAVSAHVHALEKVFGVPLFQIQRRRAFLTSEGEALLTYTERIFNLVGEAEHAVTATHDLERGRLTCAASPTIGIHLLPPILSEFHDRYPGIRVQLTIAPSEEIVTQVRATRVPFGLVEAVVSDQEEIEVRPFATDDMVLIAPADHPWAIAGRVSRPQLESTPILRREPGSGLRRLVDRLLEEAGMSLETAMELGTTEALVAAVRAGIGIAWVPRIAVARNAELGEVGLVEVAGIEMRRTLSVVMLRRARLSGVAEAFLHMLPHWRAPSNELRRETRESGTRHQGPRQFNAAEPLQVQLRRRAVLPSRLSGR